MFHYKIFNLDSSLSLLFHCCDKTLTKRHPGKKDFISPYTFQSVIKGSQGRTEALTVEECCLRACLPSLAQLICLYSPGLPTQGWLCPQRTRPSQVNH